MNVHDEICFGWYEHTKIVVLNLFPDISQAITKY